MSLEVMRADHYASQLVTWGRGFFLACAFLLIASVLRAEETFPVLQVGSQTYSNVTVTSKTPRYIVIMHAKGLTSLKLKELPHEVLEQLGYDVGPPPPKERKAILPEKLELDPRITEMQEKTVEEVKGRI